MFTNLFENIDFPKNIYSNTETLLLAIYTICTNIFKHFETLLRNNRRKQQQQQQQLSLLKNRKDAYILESVARPRCELERQQTL